MINGNVGASILNIITESLYDKPIVVFREYVQNSVDSFRKLEPKKNQEDLSCKIWINNKDLYFLDNGKGISKEKFFDEMKSIGFSEKDKSRDIGYKGIGRLSGISYCNKLVFINVCSFKNNDYQMYCIDSEKYNMIKRQPNYNELSFGQMMESIGRYIPAVEDDEKAKIQKNLNKYKDIFEKQDTGFLVILKDISEVLLRIMENQREKEFYEELGWLLPVRFKEELFSITEGELFEEMVEPSQESNIIAAKSYNISFNDKVIERPINKKMLRDYTCKCNMEYAIGFHSFYGDRILVSKSNKFTGIKLYLDNMLLCDENELIPNLKKFGLIGHTPNELIQTVKGIGAMIYITDKVNISANARRTFIEVTDNDSMKFLEYLAEFVNNIYVARYALSKYSSGKKSLDQSKEKINQLRDDANSALQKLAQEKYSFELYEDKPLKFEDLDEVEKKKLIKKKLTNDINMKIKEYLQQTSTYDYDNVLNDFVIWFSSNKNS